MNKDAFLARVEAIGAVARRRDAERWSRATLSALVDLVPDAETRRHFISQLPGFLKSHLLAQAPRSLVMDRDSFVQHVAAALGTHAPEAERVLRVVYGVVTEAVAAGEIAAFEACIPSDIAAFLARKRAAAPGV